MSRVFLKGILELIIFISLMIKDRLDMGLVKFIEKCNKIFKVHYGVK
jgi:hypothetical protein